MSIASPCIACCALNDDQVCVGCYRTIIEIANWTRLSPAERAEALRALPGRKAAMPAWGEQDTQPITGDLHRAAKAAYRQKNGGG
ncbi:DUF1289 domain-containing protein [Gallaecimonas kandeliae]|uniref:DUF1289 domain-containing protein n=1 Tax=Gallaecimonas kandeliae TaxID=3029055 RepID=UPI00264A4E3A|nr:DUF1289 domain-containing protein [Gallaecimonas kandeliae]WKE64098.1 DUF1289 domain-containing protein [Gallaecimonas kandeliae]